MVSINGVDVAVGGYTEGARVYHSANQELASGGTITLVFDSERWDTDGIHSTVEDTDRLTCRTAGKYLVTGCVRMETKPGDALGAYYVMTVIEKHPADETIARTHKPSGDGFHATDTIKTIADLAVDDWVRLRVFQNSGIGLDAEKYGECSAEFMMQRIG
ncbi:hypothetical protein ES703_108332 [subsurface metagenome]